jgi:SAM-dependent methyltransferase
MMPSRATLAAIALTLVASGSVAIGARCLSPDVARCSWASLTGNAPKLDVPYLGTRPEVVARMLDMAGVGAGDRMLDLGTGDGRILIAAARRGASGTGIDIDPVLIGEARAAAQAAGVADRTRFVTRDLFAMPLGGHDVVAMFLLPRVNLKLRPALLRQLAPGTRIVSHAFDMGDWSPDGESRVGGSKLYLWRVPAAVAGHWTLNDGRRLTIGQRFQVIYGTLGEGDGALPLIDGRMTGAGIRFTAAGRTYRGTVSGDTMAGAGWRASRAPAAGR